MELLLFSVSVLPVIVVGYFIYNMDKDRENLKFLLKLFLSGVFSLFLVLIITGILVYFFPLLNPDIGNKNLFQLFISVFIGIALIEEFCKWIMVYKISYNDRNFTHVYDIIVYSVFVSLGFTFLENLFYVYSNGIGVGIMRAFLAVPGHAIDGVFMGYYFGLAKLAQINNQKKEANKYLFLSILVPTIMHGIYDYTLLAQKFIFLIIFVIFVIALYVFSIKKVKILRKINKKLINNDNYCPNCGIKIEDNYCYQCGRKNE